MSMVHACKKFHPYIFGKEVTLYNDHRPLEQIRSEETTSGSTNAAKGNDTKLSVVWPHRKVLQG